MSKKNPMTGVRIYAAALEYFKKQGVTQKDLDLYKAEGHSPVVRDLWDTYFTDPRNRENSKGAKIGNQTIGRNFAKLVAPIICDTLNIVYLPITPGSKGTRQATVDSLREARDLF